MAIERIKSGILGFDKIVNGGIPRRNIVLPSGGPGMGKTIFCWQFLYFGLTQGEPGVLVTLEEHPVQVRQEIAVFDRDIKKYEEKGKFTIGYTFTGNIGEATKREQYVVGAVDGLEEFIDVVRSALREVRAERAVVDLVSTLYLIKSSIAKDKAGYPISVIAKELGRSEPTIRNHLVGKTEAGELILESHEMLKSSEGKSTIPLIVSAEVEHLKQKIRELKNAIREKEEISNA